MTRSLGSGSRRAVTAIAASLTVVSLLGTAAVPALGLTPTACRVKNLDTGVVKRKLQPAVDAAGPGHRLTLRGTCIGKTTIDRSLWITGIRPQGAGKPIIDAQDAGTVIVVSEGVSVTLEDLAVTGGSSSGTPSLRGAAGPAGGTIGGGIHNDGSLDLRTVVVRGTTPSTAAASGTRAPSGSWRPASCGPITGSPTAAASSTTAPSRCAGRRRSGATPRAPTAAGSTTASRRSW